jgi:hypothetical protein
MEVHATAEKRLLHRQAPFSRGPGRFSGQLLRLAQLRLSIVEREGDGRVGLVARDVAVLVYRHVHVLDPSALEAPKGAGSAADGRVDRVLEASSEVTLSSVTRASVLIETTFLAYP